MSDKIRILFLAANPKDTDKLRLDEEIREIHARIRAADFRDHFELLSRWAVRPDDLLQAFNEVRPHIVHFSGHGSRVCELMLEDNDGNAKPVSEAALVSLFRNLRDNIRLVVLNACHSNAQAEAISGEIECSIGMSQAIGDDAAISFASWFYGALAFGRSVGEAFEQGRTALMLNGIPEDSTPALRVRPGVDPLRVTFVSRAPANPILPPIAYDILLAAVKDNSPINLVRYDGGVAVVAGSTQMDCNSDLEQAALLEHAISMLVQVGWLQEKESDLYYVTHPGYEAARKLEGTGTAKFRKIKEQMPELIAEIKKGLESDDGRFVREFFVMSRKIAYGGWTKPRFVLYLEDHDNLQGKIDVLENLGFVVNVTEGKTPVFRMTEEFVSLVLNQG